MSYKIVFFDIDGTLLTTEHKIPDSTKEAIQRLKNKGINVAIATGRAPFHLKSVAEELDIQTFVGFNGSYVVYEGKVIHDTPIPVESLVALEKAASENRHPLVYLSASECFANTENHPHVAESFCFLKFSPPPFREQYYRQEKIYQAFLYCQSHEEQYYLERFADVSYVRWHKYTLDVMPQNGSKARGIEILLKHLGIRPEEAVAFGDGLNDREMLSFVGMGIAMGNAHEDLKPHANLSTRHVNEGGIRHGLELIGLIK